MGKLRWAGWTITLSTALVVGSSQTVRADIQSDRAAAIVVYPHLEVGAAGSGNDTVIRLSNANESNATLAHCFYVNANSHCSGGANDGQICNDNPGLCAGGLCVAGWEETDFRIRLTPFQPIQWRASDGLSGDALPLPVGYCVRNQQRLCASDADCNPFPGGSCTDSNAGTRIPPVPEVPFQGELRCIAIDNNGAPVGHNDLKGEALLEIVTAGRTDVASYNAIGIQATGASSGAANELIIGGSSAEYNGCPNYLILDHFFDTARDPIPGSDNTITTQLVMVPCSTDFLRQIPGSATAQFLVFNEFEQRFSTSKPVRCYDRTQLCRIGTTQCNLSIFNVAVAGTLTGQTRVNPIRGTSNPYGAGLLGVAIELHDVAGAADHRAAFNLVMQGARAEADTIILPEAQ